jgi:hypothetical protein
MKTELSFLLDLLLNDITPLELKKLIAERIKEVELNLQPAPIQRPIPKSAQVSIPQEVIDANPGMGKAQLADLMRNQQSSPQDQTMAPVVVSPIAQAALQARQQAIQIAASGKPEPGRTSPRKF